jgi:thymidylate synthase (FAD)
MSDKDYKLLNYLAKHKHYSPFNHAFLSVRVKAPVFVARQLVKHKFLPWNEVSRRYVDEEPEFYFPKLLRSRSEDKKQGSEGVVYGSEQWLEGASYYVKHLNQMYNNMIDGGVCPEQARMFLPQNMMTEWIWSGTLGAFCDMLRLRLDEHTQEETREVALAVKTYVQLLFPASFAALIEHSPQSS